LPSRVRYAAVSGLGGCLPSPRTGNFAFKSLAWMSHAFAQAPLASNDVLTLDPRPVRSRRYKPSMIAPNSDIEVG